MLRFTSTDSSPLEIQITVTAPMVYLDHCVLADLAADRTGAGPRFVEVLERADGTLFLSWAHIVELSALGPGPTFDRVYEYLKKFGGRFVIIDADPHAVIGREQRWTRGCQNPAVDEDFMRLLASNWDGRTEISPTILLDALVGEAGFFEKMKGLHRDHKASLKIMFDHERERYRTDPGVRRTLDSVCYSYAAPASMTEKTMKELARECVRTHEQFNPSDGLDFYHAVVSISYCTHVVLDKKWARRCRRVDLPKPTAAIFDGTQMHELVTALDACRKVPT